MEKERKINPYRVGRPITEPEDFFGRQTEFELIYEMLQSGHTVNITGPRQIGKSSFLKVLPHPDMQKKILGESIFDESYPFAYINMQDAEYESPLHILRSLAEQVSAGGVEVNTEVQSYHDFKKVLQTLADRITRFIIVFDEFDRVKQKKRQLGSNFFDTLRTYQQDYKVSYIVASIDSVEHIAEYIGETSPFFNIFQYLPLGLLSEDDANDLICKDDSLSLYMYFVRLVAGQHPLFISQLCFYLFHFHQYESERPSETLREKALYRFLNEAFKHFVYYWQHLSTDERTLLKKIAGGKHVDEDALPEIRDLEQKALIEHREGKYVVFSSAFEGFVKQVEFSEMKEELEQFLSKNTKAIVSLAKYCIDQFVALKKK